MDMCGRGHGHTWAVDFWVWYTIILYAQMMVVIVIVA